MKFAGSLHLAHNCGKSSFLKGTANHLYPVGIPVPRVCLFISASEGRLGRSTNEVAEALGDGGKILCLVDEPQVTPDPPRGRPH
jgi:hypothetical protein